MSIAKLDCEEYRRQQQLYDNLGQPVIPDQKKEYGCMNTDKLLKSAAEQLLNAQQRYLDDSPGPAELAAKLMAEHDTQEMCEEPQETVLETAQRLTSGDRQRDYAHPAINFARIARLWNAHIKNRYDIDVTLDATDVGWMMVNLKQARDIATPKLDNIVDGCGYLRTIERVRAYEGDKNYAP